MKKFSFILVALVIGLFLLFPSFSFAQKNKKSKTTTTKKTTPKTSSSQTKTSDTDWQVLKIEECGFSVEMPGKYEKTTQNLNSRILTAWSWTYYDSDRKASAVLWVSCKPASDDQIQNSSTLFERFSVPEGHTLISKSKMSCGSDVGVEYIEILPNGSLQQGAGCLIVNKGVYIGIQIRAKDVKTNKEIFEIKMRFWQSFKLL